MTPKATYPRVAALALAALALASALSGCTSSVSRADTAPTTTPAAVRVWPVIEKRGTHSQTITLRSPGATARFFVMEFRCTTPAASVVRTHSVVKNSGSAVLADNDRYFEGATCRGRIRHPIRLSNLSYQVPMPKHRDSYTFRITVPKGARFQFGGHFASARVDGLATTDPRKDR